MNRTFALLSGSILSLLLLNSCETTGGGATGGETVRFPTVDDVERIDRQMGLEPRQIKSRNRNLEGEGAPAPAPARVEPEAPALAPEPAAPSESTPPPQPSVDPATLQKLR